MKRGDVRTALLIALLDGPGHGYELIQVLEAKSEGRWRPSPGSVYPSLQLLSDEDLVTSTEQNGKRIYELTDAGRAEAEERITADGLPWEGMDAGRGDQGGLYTAFKELAPAMKQVGMTGSPEMVEQAQAILVQARKDIYGLLAEG